MLLVQKCKQGGRKGIRQRLGLNSFSKNHGEMKGIIQMTILEALVHLYQRLKRSCRHNNIPIFFSLVLLFYLESSAKEPPAPPLSISFFLRKQNSFSSQRDVWGEATRKQTAETAEWKLTWKILTGTKKKKKKEKKKKLTPSSEFAACLIKWLYNYTHQEFTLLGPMFSLYPWQTVFDSRPMSQVWRGRRQRRKRRRRRQRQHGP